MSRPELPPPAAPDSAAAAPPLPALAAVGALTALGGALRFVRLGAKPLWFDEAVQFWIAKTPLSGLLAENVRANSAPPLYTLLLRAVAAFADSEAALRAIAWLGGTLAIPAMYLLARRFLERPPSLLVALLTALAPMQVRYAQEVREYSLAFLVAALLLAAAHAFARRPDGKRGAAFAAALAVSVLLQYGLLVLSGAALALLALFALRARDADRSRRLRGLFAASAVWAAAFAAVWVLALRDQARAAARGPGLAASYLADGVWTGAPAVLPRFAAARTLSLVRSAFPGELFLFLVVLGVVAAWRCRARFALAALAVPTGLVFVLACARLYPYGGGRQDIFLVPMVLVLGGFGARLLARGEARSWIAAVLAVALAASGARATRRVLRDPGMEDVRTLVRTLRAQWRPGDRLYVYREANPAFLYYTRDAAPDPGIVVGATAKRPAALVADVDRELMKPGRLWILASHCVGEDCELLEERAAALRKAGRVAGDETAWLALAP